MNESQAIIISDSITVVDLDSQECCAPSPRVENNPIEKTQSLINIDEEDLITPVTVLENNVNKTVNSWVGENNSQKDSTANVMEKKEEDIIQSSTTSPESQQAEESNVEDVIMLDETPTSAVPSLQEDTGFESDEEEEEQPSIIPDHTISNCVVSLLDDESGDENPASCSATTELVNLLGATPTLEITPTPQIKTFKKHSISENTSAKVNSDKESNISISFTNISQKLIEKVQKLLDEEYVNHSKKGRKREMVSLCSGVIEANPLFVTEKINFDASYLKNLKIDVEKPSVEEKPVNSNKICYNCLGIGHVIRDCPNEMDYDQIERNRESFKSNNSRFYEAIDPKYKRTTDRNTNWNNALDMGYMASKLSERTRRKLSTSELESYKCSTPENKVHSKDVGTVSDEFLYGGALPTDMGRKDQLTKMFSKLKEHKEIEQKRKFDQVDSEDKDEDEYINVSQTSNQNKFKKNKKYKGSHNDYNQHYDNRDNNRENNRNNYKSNNRRYKDNDRYQDDRYDDRYDNRHDNRYNDKYNDNRRYEEEEYSQKGYNKDRKNKKNSNKKYSNNRR